MSGARTHYHTLGMPPDAPASALRKAYLKLARQYHPDNHAAAGGEAQAVAEQRMQAVNAAWSVLGDPDRRERYDRELRISGILPPEFTSAEREVDTAAPETPPRQYRRPKPKAPPRALTLLPIIALFAAAVLFGAGFVLGSTGLLLGAIVVAVASACLFFLVPLLVMRRSARDNPE